MTLTPPYDHPVYKPGDVVVEAMPLIYVLKKKFVATHCGGCFKPLLTSSPLKAGVAKLSKCGGCQQIQYCSRECQRFDWRNFHKHECQIFAQDDFLSRNKLARIALRCYILMKYRARELTKQYDVLGGRKICFMDLMGHEEERKSDVDFQETLHAICALFFVLDLDGCSSEFEPILCKFYINTCYIFDHDSRSVGIGLYMESSIFDHSCAPNASRIHYGLKQQVRATKDIQAQEPITVQYSNMNQRRKDRQSSMLKTHFFICQCVRCSSDSSDDGVLEKIISLKMEIGLLIFLKSADSKLLSKLCGKFLSLLKQVVGQYHPDLTEAYIECLKLKLGPNMIAGFDPQVVEEAIKITHGTDHPLYEHFTELMAEGYY